MTLRRALHRLLALFQKRRLDRELEAEIQAHLELAERDALASGMSAEEARRTARLQFGSVEGVRELQRERRSVLWLDNVAKDTRYGLAMLWRNRGFTATCLSVLALGIGANAAMFSLVDAVLLKPLPFPGAERIVRVWQAPRPGVVNNTSTLDFLDWKRLATGFEALAAEQGISAALTGSGEARRLSGRAVTADFFSVYGTHAAVGRTFAGDEDRAGSAPVVVLSHDAWQTHFGGREDVLGQKPVLDGLAHEVIGVLPPGVFDREGTEFWKPLVFTSDHMVRNFHWLTVHGRLREGTTLEQARQQMRSIELALADETPAYKRDWKITLEPLETLLVRRGLRRAITVLFTAAGFVLLIACANVANLLLARGAVRRPELAVRAALGASRPRLLLQTLTETLLLCVLGAGAGLITAKALLGLVTGMLGTMIPHTAEPTIDYRVMIFAGAIAVAVTLIVGVLPALRMNIGELSQSVHRSSARSVIGHSRLRRAIVVGEVALSLMLVSAALLLFKSFMNLQGLETGVRIENVMTASVSLPIGSYPTPERAARFYETLAERLQAVPGVIRAGLTSHRPLEWIGNGEALQVPGIDEMLNIRFKRIDAAYCPAFDIPVLAGRGITVRDRHDSPRVIVINESLATRLAEFAAIQTPVGRIVRVHSPQYIAKGAVPADVEIVGVIRNERVGAPPGRPDPPVVYVPIGQAPLPDIKLVVRTDAEPSVVLAGIRDAVRQVDRNIPLGEIATMEQVREETLTFARQPAWLIGTFAAVASALAALGLYGVLSYMVAQRRRELGVRMALGAGPTDILSLVLRSGLGMIGVGRILGVAGAVSLSRVLESLLFEVSPSDPPTLAFSCLATLAIGLAAGLLPASRALRVAPVEVLRDV